MNPILAETVDDIALFAVMLHAGDSQGIEMVLAQIKDLGEKAAEDEKSKPLADACQVLLSKAGNSGEVMVDAINKLLSTAQSFLQNPDNVSFSTVESSWGEDLSDSADDELIAEFIEKHGTLLDDLEGSLMEVANTPGLDEDSLSEFRRATKSYLHNIKGDAGSVGLTGIERATHHVEDLLLEVPAEKFVDELLAYREWVIAVTKAYASEQAPSTLSKDFIASLGARQEEVETKAPIAEEDATEEKEASQNTVEAEAQEEETYQIDGDVEILSEFMVEAEEHLGAIESLLLNKEEGFTSDDLNTIFRAMHSIKGGSSYFSMKEVTATSHAAENLMDKARNGKIAFRSSLKTLVLTYIDLERKLLRDATAALENDGVMKKCAEATSFLVNVEDLMESIGLVEGIEMPDIEEEGQVKEVATNTPAAQAEKKSPPRQDKASTAAQPGPEESKSASNRKAEIKSFVKIETKRLDHLLEYIGELVISSSMLIKNCRDYLGDREDVSSNSNQLERISREIQEIGMSMRLIPIKGLFQKMSRVVWDTAKKIGKEVNFEMEGADTELDRTVIDKLADPLMHMVRNSVDHGVEPPDVREAAGKPRKGQVRLSAYHSGGSIRIEISDDGKGLDAKKLIERAREKGLLEEGQVLSDEEAFMLIFAPGFSTAEVVTDVSGRGVGMDVVRKNIDAMRGRVSIESTLGKGSTFTIQLPLTLAIMEGIETVIGEEQFIIPSLSIVEFLNPTPEMITHTLDHGETLHFRGMFLPLFRVANLYGIKSSVKHPSEAIVVVVESENSLVALLVDKVLGKFSAVIKSLGNVFRDVEGLSGCAVMPDGSIGLILDVPTLVRLGKKMPHLVSEQSLPSPDLLEEALRDNVH